MKIQRLLIERGRNLVRLQMDSEIQEVNTGGERREDPVERAKLGLAALEVQPALTIHLWIRIMDPDTELIINIAPKVVEMASKGLK